MVKTSKPAGRIDLMFRAFSDRTRLRILYLLREGAYCVGDLVEVLRIEQPRVSRHLDYLRKAGLVSVRSAGTWRFYSLTLAESHFHEKMLECLSCCFKEVPQLQADAVRARKIKRAGGCCPDVDAESTRKKTEGKVCC